MMGLAGGLNLINNSFGFLVSIGAIASWPAVQRRFSSIETFKGRRGKRRRLLRRYLRARTLASRPSVGLADMGAIGWVMILTGVWLLVTTIGFVIRRLEGPPPTVEDAVSVLRMLVSY